MVVWIPGGTTEDTASSEISTGDIGLPYRLMARLRRPEYIAVHLRTSIPIDYPIVARIVGPRIHQWRQASSQASTRGAQALGAARFQQIAQVARQRGVPGTGPTPPAAARESNSSP